MMQQQQQQCYPVVGLQQALNLTQKSLRSLTNGGGGGRRRRCDWTLRHLVPVHVSLLHAMTAAIGWTGSATPATSTSASATNSNNINSVDSALQQSDRVQENVYEFLQRIFVSSNSDELELARTILFGTKGSEAEKLLVVQYAMIVPMSTTDVSQYACCGDGGTYRQCLVRLESLVLPLLLGSPISNDDEESVWKMKTTSDELLDAILDATFCTNEGDDSGTTSVNSERALINDDDDSMTQLNACLQRILRSIDSEQSLTPNMSRRRRCSADFWRIASRMLKRLFRWTSSTWATVLPSSLPNTRYFSYDLALQQAIAKLATACLQEAANLSDDDDEESLSAILRPMVVDLLPCLTTNDKDKDYSAAVMDVWNAVWRMIHHQQAASLHRPLTTTVDFCSFTTATTVTCVTTILCSILPCVLRDHSQTQQFMVLDVRRYDPLWELIRQCLSLGTSSYHHPSSGSSSSSSSSSSSTDNRRRRRVCTMKEDGIHQDDTHASTRMHQLHRRRGLYLLRLLVDTTTNTSNTDKNELVSMQKAVAKSTNEERRLVYWNKYVACFELLEMESEQHLIDQSWVTMTELFDYMISEESPSSSSSQVISWDWMKLLLGRILISQESSSSSSPVLRKLGLYRLLKGQAGIRVDVSSYGRSQANHGQQKMKTRKKNNSMGKDKPRGAPIEILTVDFLFNVIIPSFDSLLSSVGTNMQAAAISHSDSSGGSNTKTKVFEDMFELLGDFMRAYLDQLVLVSAEDGATDKLQDFFRRLWCVDIVDGIHHKTTVKIFQAVEATLKDDIKETKRGCIPVTDDMLKTVAESFRLSLSDGSVVPVYQEALLTALATILENSKAVGMYTPHSVLCVLAMYRMPLLEETDDGREGGTGGDESRMNDNNDTISWIDKDSALSSLRNWLIEGNKAISNGMPNFGSVIATAFVDGSLLSGQSIEEMSSAWDPKSGCTKLERSMAQAIGLLCTLPNYNTNSSHQTTASELLWPAIHKGLSHAPGVMMTSTWLKADRVSRALLLLENGVRMRVLSGMGNGDLVVDKKTEQMMPPPPAIEAMLANSVSFVLYHIRGLMVKKVVAATSVDNQASFASRSSDARVLSATFARLVEQLRSLSVGFISSLAISTAVHGVLKENIAALIGGNTTDDKNIVLKVALVFAALACGGETKDETTLTAAETVLRLRFDESSSQTVGSVQASRSIFQYAKWGALAHMLPIILKSPPSKDGSAILCFVEDLFDEAAEAVESTPADALVPLFDSVVAAAKIRFVDALSENGHVDIDTQHLAKIVDALFGLMDGCSNSNDAMYMMNEISGLIFQPALLLDEYTRLQKDTECVTPIRDAFRRLVSMAGTQRPHISRIVLCRICVTWLWPGEVGLSAIPYRNDIVRLLVHKEDHVPVTSASAQSPNSGEGLQLVADHDETSISRGFMLVFLSKFPDTASLSCRVLKDLLHYVIEKLTEIMTRPAPVETDLIMHGTTEYCIKMRALQGLCVLSKFVTPDIAELVCVGAFEAMGKQNAHNQLRYFVEIFTLQCSRKHPAVFGRALIEHMTRTDLSLQMAASLMIVSGNLIVGRYEKDFFHQYSGDQGGTVNLNAVLAGVIPWLSSTQGFTRAISQLLTYKLIPMVIDVDAEPPVEDSHWYLRSIYRFLDENPEMKRLRKKQLDFFQRYEVDSVCTAEGVLAIPVDESSEANPVHMVDVIKEVLQEVYAEVQIERAPLWKQIEVARASLPTSHQHFANGVDTDALNFQRKIIPLDALNLALEGIREQRLRNMAGRPKQNLIVCASLIDKVPNLGGLARTSEIFAADRLIVPDIQVTKMDNFKSLCVGAGDWIDIEECREQNLLEWLRNRRDEGFHIVGLEQTSSSVSLLKYTFPNKPTVLLLGKEKEGIPVELLQAVDQCLEIPQLGIIRSLNVHVSGAIAIWEFTKQKLAE